MLTTGMMLFSYWWIFVVLMFGVVDPAHKPQTQDSSPAVWDAVTMCQIIDGVEHCEDIPASYEQK